LKINESDAARVIKKSHGKLIFIKSFQSDEGEVYGFAAYKRNIFEGLKIKSVFLTYFSKGRTYFPLVNIFFEEKYSLELKKRTSNLKNLLISFSLDGFSYAVSRIDTPAEGGVIKIAFKDIKLAEIFAKISESRTLPLGFKIIKTATEN
jgi:hypothetical protein